MTTTPALFYRQTSSHDGHLLKLSVYADDRVVQVIADLDGANGGSGRSVPVSDPQTGIKVCRMLARDFNANLHGETGL